MSSRKKSENVAIMMSKEEADIVSRILDEEGLPLDGNTVYDALMYRYASANRTHAWQLGNLYAGVWSLRRTAAAIAEKYYEHKHPEIERLVVLIGWLENHLQGIPFASAWDPAVSGDYDPTRPAQWLDGMHRLFNRYQCEGEKIDRMHDNPVLAEIYRGVEKGDGGESEVITSHELYNLYKNGYFKKQEDDIKNALEAPDISPSKALSILRRNWEFYTTPATFNNMNRCIEYCIYCAADFPDTPGARAAFRRAVRAIHAPLESI